MTETLDTTGLLCPLPVLKTRKRLMSLPDGTVLRVTTDDPMAIVDMPHFCAEAGHDVVDQTTDGAVTTWRIRKGGTQAAPITPD